MALSAAERKRNQRARDKVEREKLATLQPNKPTEEQIQGRLSQHVSDLEWATQLDAEGNFYKSECRSLVQLLAFYEGANPGEKEPEEDETPRKKKRDDGKEKQRRPSPWTDKLSIRAIELIDNGISVKIDPDQFEYETLSGQKVNLRRLYEVDENVSFRRWLDLRDKARKNLFWLCNLVNMPMFHKPHQPICDMFVQKNFDGLFFPGFTRGDLSAMFNKQVRVAQDGVTPTKTMILFAPRGGRKSTIDGIDALQWMLNCPDVRILIATAFRSLAKQLFGEIKGYFYMPLSAEPTALQILFPEYVLYGRKGESETNLKCPAAIHKSKDFHLWKTSMESSSVGMRCDIRKLDDVVDYVNSNTEELREGLERKINATGDLLAKGGFTDIIGTRYFTKDWYGSRMSKEGTDKSAEPYAYMSISAWTPKPQYRVLYDQLLKETNGMFKVTEEMVDLWCSQLLPFEALASKLKEKKEISFKNQQLNIATDPKEVDNYIFQFDEDVLRAHTYQRSAAPENMVIVQSWDIAYSATSRTSDYSVGATLGFYRNSRNEDCCVVLEVFFDKWKSSELASNMIKYYEKWRPFKVYVENNNGVAFVLDQISNYAKLHGSDMFSNFRARPISNKPNAKADRIKDAEFLLGHDRLWFVDGGWITETYKQFSEYKGGKSTAFRKDDIPDAVALGIISHMPRTSLQHNPDPKDIEAEHEKRVAESHKQEHYNRLFGSLGKGHLSGEPNSGPIPSGPSPTGYVTTARQWDRRRSTEPAPAPPAPEPAHPKSFPRGGGFAVLPASFWRKKQ